MRKPTADLPNAPSYEFIDPNMGRVFNRDRTYNMDHITDKQIDLLIQKDHNYWSKKFKKKVIKTTDKKKVKSLD